MEVVHSIYNIQWKTRVAPGGGGGGGGGIIRRRVKEENRIAAGRRAIAMTCAEHPVSGSGPLNPDPSIYKSSPTQSRQMGEKMDG